jgi:hypothetical protein
LRVRLRAPYADIGIKPMMPTPGLCRIGIFFAGPPSRTCVVIRHKIDVVLVDVIHFRDAGSVSGLRLSGPTAHRLVLTINSCPPVQSGKTGDTSIVTVSVASCGSSFTNQKLALVTDENPVKHLGE